MRLLAVTVALALGISWPGPAAQAAARALAEPAQTTGDEAAARDLARIVDQAQEAWARGQWSQVRALLDPHALDPVIAGTPELRERALPILADATLADDSMDLSVRRRLAASYLDHLLQTDPNWRMPQGVYTPELLALFQERLQARERASVTECVAQRNACRADLSEATEARARAEAERARIEALYRNQEVEIRERIKRSRAWALIPFGVGHLYSGNLGKRGTVSAKERRNAALGFTFLTLEAAIGATGLALVIRRAVKFGCRRTNGFAAESVRCATSDREGTLRNRKAEEVFGWMFLGTAVLDVVLAQILFEPVSTSSVRRVPRHELERERREGPARRRSRRSSAAPGARRRVILRPGAGPLPAGAALTLGGRF